MRNAEVTEWSPAQEALYYELLQPVDEDNAVSSVLSSFTAIAPLLTPAGLTHVVPFWNTYHAVSQRVHDQLGSGVFDRDDDVAKTLPIFFNQARKPIQAYVEGRPQNMSPEWRRSLYSRSLKRSAPGMQFLGHMNSHINSDLGQALAMSGADDAYKHDYTTMVGTILEEVAFERAPQLVPVKSVQLQKFMLSACLNYIAYARENAWNNGKALQALHGNEPAYAAKVVQIERDAVVHGRAMQLVGPMALRAAVGADSVAYRFQRPPMAA